MDPTRFSYDRFSASAREVVLSAAAVARSADATTVLPEHLAAAANGATRDVSADRNLGHIPFAKITVKVLRDVFDKAVETARLVEPRDLLAAFD